MRQNTTVDKCYTQYTLRTSTSDKPRRLLLAPNEGPLVYFDFMTRERHQLGMYLVYVSRLSSSAGLPTPKPSKVCVCVCVSRGYRNLLTRLNVMSTSMDISSHVIFVKTVTSGEKKATIFQRDNFVSKLSGYLRCLSFRGRLHAYRD